MVQKRTVALLVTPDREYVLLVRATSDGLWHAPDTAVHWPPSRASLPPARTAAALLYELTAGAVASEQQLCAALAEQKQRARLPTGGFVYTVAHEALEVAASALQRVSAFLQRRDGVHSALPVCRLARVSDVCAPQAHAVIGAGTIEAVRTVMAAGGQRPSQ